MKKLIILFFILTSSVSTNAQEYQFINEVIIPYEEDNPIPLDTIFFKKRFIILGEEYMKLEYLNEETFRFWWSYGKTTPPIELFLKNFNLNHLKLDIIKSQNDSIINFKALNNYFFSSDDEFIKNNRKNKYLSISKPFFNCNMDWSFIVKSQYIPYTNTGGDGVMFIYVKINNKWILYHTISLWIT